MNVMWRGSTRFLSVCKARKQFSLIGERLWNSFWRNPVCHNDKCNLLYWRRLLCSRGPLSMASYHLVIYEISSGSFGVQVFPRNAASQPPPVKKMGTQPNKEEHSMLKLDMRHHEQDYSQLQRNRVNRKSPHGYACFVSKLI
jgi:hypothetical protein